VGILAVSLTRRTDLAVPDPAAAVREQRRQVKVERKARAIAARPTVTTGNTLAPLGVSLGGDLPASWRAGKYVVLPDHAARLPRLAIGVSGAGKSTYIGREVHLAALADRQVIALDGKGDRGFVQAITDAYAAARPGASVHVFPDAPLDGWRGDPAALVNRLLGCWAWSIEAAYYREVCVLALRLACSQPGPPIQSMGDLVNRLDPSALARSWAKHPAEAGLVKMLQPKLGDVAMRVANLAAAIAGQLDGTAAIGEADLTIVSLPTMANRGDAEALFRILMADVGHWASVRKTSRPALLVVDEFSAISGGREQAIDVMERGRSFGVPSLLSGQSYASLGPEEDRDRIVSAAASLVLFASNTPEELSKLAGSIQTTEAVLQAEDGRWTGRASVTTRARHRVDPNAVRQLQPGQAVVISGGRAERIQVIQAPGANNDLALPRRPFGPLQGDTRPSIGRVKGPRLRRRPAAALDPPNGPGPETSFPVPGRSGPADDRTPNGGEAIEQP
jgi:hypothetical protein